MAQEDVLFRFRLQTMALARDLGNVGAACRIMGIHQSTYYRWRKNVERYGVGHAVAAEQRRPRRSSRRYISATGTG